MTTPARWRALRWFDDHGRDVNTVMGRKQPTARMRNLMIREGQVVRLSVGAFDHGRFLLTEAGAALLATRRERRRSS